MAGVLLLSTAFAGSASGASCILPDDGSGTGVFPPLGCELATPEPVILRDGLPGGATLELTLFWRDFACMGGDFCSVEPPADQCEVAGGIFSGRTSCFASGLEVHVRGTGILSLFETAVGFPVESQIDTAPRAAEDVDQRFAVEMGIFQGELSGDPNLCLLRFTGGTTNGLPASGEMRYTRLAGGDYNAEGQMSPLLQVAYEGCAGGPLDGISGSETAVFGLELGAAIPPAYRYTVLQSTIDSEVANIGRGAMNDVGSAAWVSLFDDDSISLFRGRGGEATEVTSTRDTQFSLLGPPDLNDAGDMIFLGVEEPPTGDPFEGVYVRPGGGVVEAAGVQGSVLFDSAENPTILLEILGFMGTPQVNDQGLALVTARVFDQLLPFNPPSTDKDADSIDALFIVERKTGEQGVFYDFHPQYEASNLDKNRVGGKTWVAAAFERAQLNDANEILTWAVYGEQPPQPVPDPLVGAILTGGTDADASFAPLPLIPVADNIPDEGRDVSLSTDFAFNGHGDVLFRGRFVAERLHDGLFLLHGGGTIRVVDPDDPDITSFTGPMALNDERDVAFKSSPTGYPNALFVWSPGEPVQRVFSAAPGDHTLLDWADQPLRETGALVDFQIADIDDEGQLLLWLRYDDAEELLVFARPEALPEPTATALQIGALLALGGLCRLGPWKGSQLARGRSTTAAL